MTLAIPRPRLVPIRWGEIQLLPKREPLIEGVFDVGAMSALVGASGAYKTGIAVDWAGHVGTGVPWRGHSVRKGVALYLAVEGGRGIAERFEAWRQHNGVNADDGDVYLIPESIDLAHGDVDTKLLLERIVSIGPVDFIVADTLSRSLAGGDENSSKDMGGFVRNCDLIRSETGAHICVLHHLGKDESRMRMARTTVPPAMARWSRRWPSRTPGQAERKAWSRALQTARGTHLIGGESSCGHDLIWLAS
jgi:RecA-family ATPase